MQIKTVYCRAEIRDEFDSMVNKALSDGWNLSEIQVLKAENPGKYTMLYALLKKED